MKTKELEKAYLQDGGMTCPFCGSNDIESGELEFFANTISQGVACNSCNKEWVDEYTLTAATFNSDDVD